VHPVRREDVQDRDREQEPPREDRPPPPDSTHEAEGALADDVVAVVDRFEQGVEVSRRPERFGRGDEDDRVRRVGQSLLQRPTPADPVRRDDESIGRAFALFEEVEQPLGHLVGGDRGVGSRAVQGWTRVDHDHPDAATGDGRAQGGGVERVNPLVVGQRPVTFTAGEGLHGRRRSREMG